MIIQHAHDRFHHSRGPFRIWRSYPGRGISDDTGLGPIGAIDHADLLPGLLVPMHEHRDDEIISYLRRGEMHHVDDHGTRETVSPSRLMVMNAGRGFSHEESVPADGVGVEMLQIFLRPRDRGMDPTIQFADLESVQSAGRWRLLSAPAHRAALTFIRTDVDVFDVALAPSEEVAVPRAGGCGSWLYVFRGEVDVAGHHLGVGDSVASPLCEAARITAKSSADLVCFLYNPAAAYTDRGSLSGRRR